MKYTILGYTVQSRKFKKFIKIIWNTDSWKINSITPLEIKTGWKISVFRVFLVRIFPHLDWIFRIQSECGKIRTRKIPETDTFQSVIFCKDFVDVSHENASFFRGDLTVICLHDFSYQTLYSIDLRLTNQIKQKFLRKIMRCQGYFFKKNTWEISYSKKGLMSEIHVRATGFESRIMELANKDSAIRRNWSAVAVT